MVCFYNFDKFILLNIIVLVENSIELLEQEHSDLEIKYTLQFSSEENTLSFINHLNTALEFMDSRKGLFFALLKR